MKLAPAVDPGVVEFRSGGVSRVISGSIWVAFGGGCAYYLFFFLTGWSDRMPLLAAIPVVVTAYGLCVLFGRHAVRADAGRDIVQRWWSLFRLPLLRRELRLSRFDRVEVRERERRRSGDVLLTYPVSLSGAGGVRVVLAAPRDRLEAVTLAETSAKRLGLPLSDRTGAIEVFRKAEAVGASIGELAGMREGTERPPAPGPVPPSLAPCASVEDGALRLRIAPRFLGRHKGLLPWTILAVGAAIPAIAATRDPFRDPRREALFLGLVLAFMLPTLATLVLCRKWFLRAGGITDLLASPKALALRFGTYEVFWPAAEIRELMLTRSSALTPEPERMTVFDDEPGTAPSGFVRREILVRGRGRETRFGSRFSAGDLEWIYRAVYATLVERAEKASWLPEEDAPEPEEREQVLPVL